MFRNLYHRLFFQSDLNNVNGLKRYGERCLNHLFGRTKKRSASARKHNLGLIAKQKSTEAYLKSVQPEKLVDDNEYFGIRVKIRTGTFFIIGIFITESLLGYYSTLVLISGDDFGIALLRWLIAIGLTFGAISTSEKLIEAFLPHRFHKASPSSPRSIPVIIIWSVMLIGVQLAIVGVAEARVRDIEGGHAGSIIYYGFIALSMVLPLIAGAIGWEIAGFYDAYKQTGKYRKAQKKMEELTHHIERNIQREEDVYNVSLSTYWDVFNDFRSYKENYNLKKGLKEELNDRFCYDFEEFKHTATLRYGPVRKELKIAGIDGDDRKKVLTISPFVRSVRGELYANVRGSHAPRPQLLGPSSEVGDPTLAVVNSSPGVKKRLIKANSRTIARKKKERRR